VSARRAAALAVLLSAASLAGCSDGSPAATAQPVIDGRLLEVSPANIRSPDGTMTLIFGGETDPRLLLSAGFFRRSEVGAVETPSWMAWAPDSRSFFINDSGSAAWSVFRLWTIAGAEATESGTIRRAAIAELGRRNGCAQVPEPDATSSGLGWSSDGARVYVLAQGRRQTGDCVWRHVDYVVAVADVRTGELIEVAAEQEARQRWPNLRWGAEGP
jgi:hypothetical protein